uniref:Uncharacterized protein n=1 Tax=Leersia perrieri TaxID=77586 RepID=A0A0D9XU46_9ORYZ
MADEQTVTTAANVAEATPNTVASEKPKPCNPVVGVIDGEEVVIPNGKVLLSKGLVDKILSLDVIRSTLLDEEISDELRESIIENEARKDKFVECQARPTSGRIATRRRGMPLLTMSSRSGWP